MAKMTETQALELLATASALAMNITAVLPVLIANIRAIRDGLAATDEDALNAQIVAAHGEIQSLDKQLAALRSTGG